MSIPKFSHIFNKLKNTYKKIGLFRFIKRMIYYRHDDVIISFKKLNEDITTPFKDRIEIKGVERKELHILEELCKNRYDLQIFKEYFKNDCNCFIAKLNEKIIGYIWWGNKNMGSDFKDPEMRFLVNKITNNLKNDGICSFDFFVDPEYRGSGNANVFMQKALLALKELGYNTVNGWVNCHNIPARWTYKLFEYKDIERLTVRRFFLFLLVIGGKLSFDSNGHKILYRADDGIMGV
jgi:GNAT superfamily N-acetyltransferase